jgi:HEAT repeat protein
VFRRSLFPILGGVLLTALGAVEAAPAAALVLRHPRPESPLPERVVWAVAEAKRLSLKDGFWIAYSFRRLMGARSFIGRFESWPRRDRPTLEALISPSPPPAKPVPDEEVVRRAAEEALARSRPGRGPERKIWKDLGVLMKYHSSSDGGPVEVSLGNLSLRFDLEGLPLFWLGPARDDDSVLYLTGLYDRMPSAALRGDVLDAIGLHDSPDLVVPFLDKVLNGPGRDALRGEAASYLGEQRDERAVVILKRAARTDPSAEVRSQALSGLAESEMESAEDVVIDIALHAGNRRLREEALSALAEIASRKAVTALDEVSRDDPDSEVQESAVDALSELPADEGLPLIISIAKTHSNPVVRKAAIRALGESGDIRALETLIVLVKGRS